MNRATSIFASLLVCLLPLGWGLLVTNSSPANAQEATAAASGVSGLVKALASPEAAKRWNAAQDLGEMGPAAKAALPALLGALGDKNASVRLHAAIAIGRIGDKSDQTVQKLIAAVGDSDSRVRVAAATSVRELVSDPAVLIPMAVANMDQPLFASRVVETAVLRGENSIPFLMAALKDERAAYWACLAIEELGEVASPTVPAIIALLDSNPDDSLKLQALLALAKIGPKAASAKKQVLAALASGSSTSVTTGAAFAAGELGFTEAATRLQQIKHGDEPLLHMVAIWALAKLHPEDKTRLNNAVDHLIEGLESDDATMRLAAAEGLQSLPIEPESVAPKLIHLLNDADPIVAHNLVETFAGMGESVAPRAGGALANEELRDFAVQVLARLGAKAKPALPQIVAALSGAEGDFRLQLQSIVGQIGPSAASATAELTRSLDSDSGEVRIGALLALGSIGPGAAAASDKALALAAGSKDPFQRILAAWAIAKIASADKAAIAKAVPVLTQGLSFPDGRVQAESAITLGELGSAAGSAAKALEALAANENAPLELREIAKEAAAAVR